MGVADIGSHSLHPSAVELLVSSLGVNGINLFFLLRTDSLSVCPWKVFTA
jgi:hypothetical protein